MIKYIYDKWSEENTDKIGWWKELTTSGCQGAQARSFSKEAFELKLE